MYQKYYQRFLKSNEGVQHYACHSHHYWPDVTREAMLEYWDDSARLVDGKWDYIFSEKIPSAQKLIAEVLNLSHPEQIVFAPNTHEFLYRLLSCFFEKDKIKILTTDSEFYSFERQIKRLIESGKVELKIISTLPYETFEERFKNEIDLAKKSNLFFDMVFLSQVFFNSGVVLNDLENLVTTIPEKTMIVVDGYHGFMAIPTNLSSVEDRIFYIAGSYKYAQGGEGCCFMSVPKSSRHRPEYTGWFASFSQLAMGYEGEILYSYDGLRFAGSTMDFSALYRLISVLNLFKNEGLTTQKIHEFVQKLQFNFLKDLDKLNHPILNRKQLQAMDLGHHGHFLTFDTKSSTCAKDLVESLEKELIKVDYRGSRLRFGFGLYQEENINFKNFK
ncbi:MAG: aminotransferase class V-fold PLP-dependent enzyme [Pseudobdellovibrio sp.]